MFQKRRSMLGRRHLLAQQQAVPKSTQPQTMEDGSSGSHSGGNRSSNSSWRGRRSGKKKTPSFQDKASKEFKKCLFSKSPSVGYLSAYRMQGQERIQYSSNENLLNETGIIAIAPTPSTTKKDKTRVGPLPSTSRPTPKETIFNWNQQSSSSSSSFPTQSSRSYDFDNLKPPDSPGPSRLERILLEEKLAQNSSSSDFYNLKPPTYPGPSRLDTLIMKEKLAQTSPSSGFCNLDPPKSPGPSHLDRIIMEERLEQPLDPDLKRIESSSLEDVVSRLQFSPPLSSTCIGSPDSGTKSSIRKETAPSSGRKLSIIKEDIDTSITEFEINERTIQYLDETIMETKVNNTVKPNKFTYLENILEEQTTSQTENSEPTWENIFSQLDSMESTIADRAVNLKKEIDILKEKIETIQQRIESNTLEDIKNIREIKKTLQLLKSTASVEHLTENKENEFSFRVPTCKKMQLEESKWFNSVKKENPGLLKTPKPNKKINRSAMLTPHSLSTVLHDQMNELYK